MNPTFTKFDLGGIDSPNANSVCQATTKVLNIVGTLFVNGVVASFDGSGITVNSTTFIDAQHLAVNVTVADSESALGQHALTITNPDTGTVTAAAALWVVPLPLETRIRNTLQALIPATMTRANGYCFDWGTVDEYSSTKQMFPASTFRMNAEIPNSENGQGQGFSAEEYDNIVKIAWQAYVMKPPQEAGATIEPADIDPEMDKAIFDVKKFIFESQDSGEWWQLRYQGYKRHWRDGGLAGGVLEFYVSLYFQQDMGTPSHET